MNPDKYKELYGVSVMIANSNIQMPFFHKHDGYEIYMLLRGDRTYFINDETIRLQDGEIALIKPETLHKTGGKMGHRILCDISNSFLQKYFTNETIKRITKCFNNPHRAPTKEQHDQLVNLFSEMFKMQDHDEEEFLFALVLEVLNIIKDCPVSAERLSANEKLVSRITDYINKNFAEIKGVEETAEKFYINKCYLCRVFKKITGIPFVSYLNNVRLAHAASLLVSTRKDISDIAMLCGFNSTAYFCNVFKTEFGLTPRAYRVANFR